MKTLTVDEINGSRKSAMDYKEDHRKMVQYLKDNDSKEELPEDVDSPNLWNLSAAQDPFHFGTQIFNEDGTPMEGSFRVKTTQTPEEA